MKPTSPNVVWHHATVTRERREKLQGHRGVLLWFTGLPSAGKSTVAHATEERLHQLGCRTFVLDGDNVRHGLCGDLGFTAHDREEMNRHTVYGHRILSASDRLHMAAEIALNHHEKWDGSGYPYGLKGEEIPLSGRIVALADVYDALTSKRVYKPAFSHDTAKSIILEGSGRHFDPRIVQAFLRREQEFIAIGEQFRDGPQLSAPSNFDRPLTPAIVTDSEPAACLVMS